MTHDRIALVIYLMMILGAVIVVLAICMTVVTTVAFRKTERGAARILSLMMQQAGTLQFLTVVTIVMSAFILRILDAIGADATISVLSGVAGYVLGGFARSPSNISPDDPVPHSK